jgi:hypothetical protein
MRSSRAGKFVGRCTKEVFVGAERCFLFLEVSEDPLRHM